MKIAFLWYHFIQFGGVERVLTQKINLLAEMDGYEVYLITYNQGNHPFKFNLSSRIKHVDLNTRYFSRCSYHGIYQFWDRFISLRKFYKTITTYLENLQPDILVCVDHRESEVNAVLRSNIKGVKIVESHSGKLTRLKEIQSKPFLRRVYEKQVLHSTLKKMSKLDAIVCLTRHDADDWRKNIKTVVIPNILIKYPEKGVSYDNEHKHIISAGRLSIQKGFDYLQEAWIIVVNRHPDWILDIYGDVDVREGVYFEKQNLPGLVFHAATDDIYSQYTKSDFYVLSSRFESFGLVLIEAMSCGIPCVSFDCPYGPREIIHDRVDGLLVSYPNIYDLAEKMCWMIEHKDERAIMGKNARENVKRFQPNNVMGLWDKFYKSLI